MGNLLNDVAKIIAMGRAPNHAANQLRNEIDKE